MAARYQLAFREWFVLLEGVNMPLLTSMWKKAFPGQTDQQVKQALDGIIVSDPTPNKEYTPWLTREVINRRLRLPEDAPIIGPDLTFFHDLKRRNQLRRLGVEPNIDKYKRHDFQNRMDALRAEQGGTVVSKRQEQDEIKAQGAEKLHQDATWMVVKAKTEEACVAYGKGTRWCTAATNGNMANHYLKDGPIYVIWKDKQPFAQLHVKSGQFMDPTDAPIDQKELPDDIKDILFRVVPKETAKDHLFFYRMTGKLDPKVKEEADQSVVTQKGAGGAVLKMTPNPFAAEMLAGQDDETLDPDPVARPDRPFYALTLPNGQAWFWQFWLDEGVEYYGFVWRPNNKRYGRSAQVIGKDRNEYSEESFPLIYNEAGKVANEMIRPKSVNEAIALFAATELTNPASDKVLLDYVKSWDADTYLANFSQYKSHSPINMTLEYFNKHKKDDPAIYRTVREKAEELRGHYVASAEEHHAIMNQRVKEKAASPEDQVVRQRLVNRSHRDRLTRIQSNLHPLHTLMGDSAADHAGPEERQHLVDTAKQGYVYPLYNYMSTHLNRLFKRDKNDPWGPHQRQEGTPPWGDDGWPEAEPYFVKALYKVSRSGFTKDALNGISFYADTTKDPKATRERLSEYLEKTREEEDDRRRQDAEDDLA